jgi:predicted DNA-binding protein (MmcQ/YjbR family)
MIMNAEWIRTICLAFPAATEQIQWGNDLVFKVAGKMFAVTPLEPAAVWLTFKASDDNFLSLTEQPGIIPAPYLARAKWVALEAPDSLPLNDVAALLRASYDLVIAKLPKSSRDKIAAGGRSSLASKAQKEKKSPARAKKNRSARSSPKRKKAAPKARPGKRF